MENTLREERIVTVMDTLYSYTRLVHRLSVLCAFAKADNTPIMEPAVHNCLLYFIEYEYQLWSLATLTGTPEGSIRARFAIDEHNYPDKLFDVYRTFATPI